MWVWYFLLFSRRLSHMLVINIFLLEDIFSSNIWFSDLEEHKQVGYAIFLGETEIWKIKGWLLIWNGSTRIGFKLVEHEVVKHHSGKTNNLATKTFTVIRRAPGCSQEHEKLQEQVLFWILRPSRAIKNPREADMTQDCFLQSVLDVNIWKVVEGNFSWTANPPVCDQLK